MRTVTLLAAATATAGVSGAAIPQATGSGAAAEVAVDDARRAAAGRVLEASRFRARQAVLLDDSLRAARSELTRECLDRAAAGQSLDGCRATAEPTPAVAARLAARRAAMLDEVMTASQTIYARRFTAAEMDEITRFFGTPVGRKYGALYPGIIAEVQVRKAAIARRFLVEASRGSARR